MPHEKSAADSDHDQLKPHLKGGNSKEPSTTPVPAPRSATHHQHHHHHAHHKTHLEEVDLKDSSATPVPASRSAVLREKTDVVSDLDNVNGHVDRVDGKDHSESKVPVSPLTPHPRNPANGSALTAEEELFDSAILLRLDFTNALSDYGGAKMSPAHPGENLTMRSLRRGDFDRGYTELLSQLAVVGNVTREVFQSRFDSMARCPNTYFTIVLEDTVAKKVVGAVTLVVEQKFIHTAALRGRVEDVVTHRDRRGQNLGKLLLDTATILGRHLGCYKLSLECKDSLVAFYRQFGYQTDAGNNYMIQRFRD
ncbi:putative glucosamine 6-phosphate N-acetyltransferase [Hypsibius exemplaris]|uniref:Glucosamine 6-phosphate N-acetyltransferase n=1 Tax=Hypsibius exemplaris TaxID=2072580 RepID=A0A1W0WN26_HYPEX|nr:putative glucosamine 6-phosphate N-acetyltransferase [Hypsibius exemplaris]